MQLSPEDQKRVFGKDKLKTAYQKKKRSLNLNRRATRDYITSMKFDRMIPSGSSWLMGIKVHRVYNEAHAAMEAGKSISATKLHLMTGHTGEHLLKPTANYMKLKLIGRLPPCEACAKAKIRQRTVQKKKIKKMPTKPGYRVFIDISSLKQVSRGGNKHWLIMVDEFSDYTHSFS